MNLPERTVPKRPPRLVDNCSGRYPDSHRVGRTDQSCLPEANFSGVHGLVAMFTVAGAVPGLLRVDSQRTGFPFNSTELENTDEHHEQGAQGRALQLGGQAGMCRLLRVERIN